MKVTTTKATARAARCRKTGARCFKPVIQFITTDTDDPKFSQVQTQVVNQSRTSRRAQGSTFRTREAAKACAEGYRRKMRNRYAAEAAKISASRFDGMAERKATVLADAERGFKEWGGSGLAAEAENEPRNLPSTTKVRRVVLDW